MPLDVPAPAKVKVEEPITDGCYVDSVGGSVETMARPLGLAVLEDGNNSDEYIDTSLGRCGAGDMNDDESYIKASHDLLTQSSEDIIPRSTKRLRFSLPDDDSQNELEDNSSAEEKNTPWVEEKQEPRRRRKNANVRRYITNANHHESDSDDGLHKNGNPDAFVKTEVKGEPIEPSPYNGTLMLSAPITTDSSNDSSAVTVEIYCPDPTNFTNNQFTQLKPEPTQPTTSTTSKPVVSVPLSLIQGKASVAAMESISNINILPDKNGFICHLCPYTAKMPYLIENHMKTTHLNFQPYMCMACQKTFHLRGTAMCHIRIRHPNGSQMVIDQDTEAKQWDECIKLLKGIIRCHVCESKGSNSKAYTTSGDGKLYICASHAENYSIGVNINSFIKQ